MSEFVITGKCWICGCRAYDGDLPECMHGDQYSELPEPEEEEE